VDTAKLDQAEAMLRKHKPADFDSTIDAAPESIEAVRFIEDNDLWKARYSSVDEFYAAYEAQHPDVRVYGDVRREIANADVLRGPHGTITQRIARHREASRGDGQ
jgi:hypothetical protein